MELLNSPIVLEGWISVLAALNAGYRTIHHIYLQAEKTSLQRQLVARRAQQANVPSSTLPQAELQQYTQSRSHGGVVAVVSERRYQPLSTLGVGVDNLFVAMLDGVEDPFNFGQAVRALYAAGAHGLVVRARHWIGADAVVARASAGAAEMIPTAVVASPLDAVDHFRARGIRIACTSSMPAHQSIYAADLRQPLFLVIGGERRGIGRALLAAADLQLRIPYGGDFEQALDVTSATAILAFEVLRQRGVPLDR